MFGLMSSAEMRRQFDVYTGAATPPRFTARVSSLAPDDFIVMDGKTGRQVMNGKGMPLVLDTMADAQAVASEMCARVALLTAEVDPNTGVAVPRDSDNDAGYDSDDYQDLPALLSATSVTMRGLFG